jgi:hypothetical protein
MNLQERTVSYGKQIRKHYGLVNLKGLVPGDLGVPDDEFHFVDMDSNRHIIVFDVIDPVRFSEYYNTPDENVQIIVDADELPDADKKGAEHYHGVPPMALVAAIRVEADIFQKGRLIRLVDNGGAADSNSFKGRVISIKE